jgi:hypothetical protein
LYQLALEEVEQWLRQAIPSPGRTFTLGGREFTEAPRAVRVVAGGSGWEAYSPLDGWPESVEILCDCHALEVLADEHGVQGLVVEKDGGRQVIRTRNAVLAAGTVENSRLVIQALRRVDESAPVELTGLVDKVAQGFVAAFDPATAPESIRGAAQPDGLFLCRADSSLRSSLFVRTYVNEHGLLVVDCYCMGEQTPGPHGRVWCEPGPRPPWPVFVAGRLGSADEVLVQHQRHELARLYEELSGAATIAGGGLVFEEAFGSADLAGRLSAGDGLRTPGQAMTYSFPLGSEQHEAGTLPLGGSIVDDRSRVRAISGLHVAGPCTFPRTGAANPALTILALSARLAAEIMGQGPVAGQEKHTAVIDNR